MYKALVPMANKIWNRLKIRKTEGKLNIGFSMVVKRVQLECKNVFRRYGCVVYDEAQDANPCMSQVIQTILMLEPTAVKQLIQQLH